MDALAVISEVIAEHHTVRENLKRAGDRLSDIEAIFALNKTYSGWTQSSVSALADEFVNTRQAVVMLDEGMKAHFAYEESALPPIFGEVLMNAIISEHKVFNRQLALARQLLGDIRLEGMPQPEMLSLKVRVQQTINGIIQVISEHANHEEVILGIIEKSLVGNTE